MARNRKRAKERRSRRRLPAPGARPGVATARAGRDGHHGADETPSPLEHATPDAELAEAQLAVGRPEFAGEEDAQVGYDESEADAGELAVAPDTAPAPRAATGNRLINFLQGSWRELQRVQWPDRRQVMQATGVVIGFVVVAGLFLGLADTVASKLVTLILK